MAEHQRHFAERYQVRTGLVPGAVTLTDPAFWDFHDQFDPKYCISHAKWLSRSIWQKLQAKEYTPVPAVAFDIPKPDGSSRQVMSFTIPDSALSNVIHRALTRRNINIFSSYSFAYRPDRGVFDAMLHLRRSISTHKSYVIQYDFSSYFDSIDHDFLLKLLFNRRLFFVSDAERVAIEAFLKHRFARFPDYPSGLFKTKTKGVPQGTSISLFLANAAAHDLDLTLEGQNGTFTRFADDVVAITRSYGDALAVAAIFREHCKDAGLAINYIKSPGIQLFVGGPDREKREFVIDTDDGSRIENIMHINYV
ncbi:MAG: reverse transcriptase domain-containing protein, partial [Caulobacteraceae bacterium]